MYRHLLFVLTFLLWPGLRALKVDALAIAPAGSVITATNQTEMLSTLNLTLPKALSNETLPPSQNFITYRVPNSLTTLLFHSFGATIPTDELLRAVAFAVGIAFDHIAEKRGKKPIATGVFVYSHEFLNLDKVSISLADFREDGKPMTYYILKDVLRGIGEFVLFRGQVAQEMQFEVEVRDLGYLGTGHVEYKPAAAPTSSIV